MAPAVTPATRLAIAGTPQLLRPLAIRPSCFAAPGARRRTFVLRAARASLTPQPADEEPASPDLARGVLLSKALGKNTAGKDDAPQPTTKPAGILGALLAAVMLVRAC